MASVHGTGDTATTCGAGGRTARPHEAPPSGEEKSVTAEKKE